MAVTGSNRILRSNTASAVPSSLEEGQLAINHADRRLYFRGPSGAVESIDLGFNPALKANLASPLFTGQVQIGQGHSLRFPHASQADAADGTIGAGIYGSGLNIVGVQTGAGLGRQIRLWGVLHAQEGLFVGHSGYNGAIAIDGAANSWRVLDFRHAGVLHWRLQAAGDGNKNFVIAAQNDAGAWLRNALVIDRITGSWAITGDVVIAGGLSSTSYVIARQSGSTGYTQLNTGSATNPGFLAWHTPDGLRRGYIGWKSSAGDYLQINLENGWGLEINGSVRFNSVPLFRGGLGGVEGGEIAFERPASGTALAGNVTQDINGNRWRMFEGGGSFRGFHVDFTTCTGSSRLWHEGNDGAGSGLDADTLDGLHASAFITSASPNLTGTPTVSSNPIWHDGNTPGAPAYIKDAAIRPREAWDNATFRAAVKAGNDASNGLEEVINQPGRIRMPDQGEAIKINRRLSMYEHGTRLEGTRLGTRIYFTAANCGIDVKGLYHVEINGVSFFAGWKAGAAIGGVIPTGGAAIGTGLTPQNTGCHDLQLRNITFDGVFNSIDGYVVNKLICEDMYIRDVYGTHGIRVYGSSANLRSDLFHINRVGVDNPTPYSYQAAQFRGAWAPGTAYFAGDVVSSNSRFYQCESGAVSGPTSPFTSNPDGTIEDGPLIVDWNAFSGGAGQFWRRLFRTSLAGLLQDSYAYTLETDSFVALNVPYGFRMLDSVAAANGASEPIWAYLHNSDFEHNAYNGVLLSHGSGFRSNLGYIGVTKGGAGLHVAAAYRGEGTWQNGEIRLNAQQGAAIYSPFSILNTDFPSNGQAGAGLYDQILVGANVSYVKIIGNTFCPAAKVESINGPMNARRPIAVQSGTSNRLMIVGNQAWGHHTSNAVLNSSTGTGQIIDNNSP